MTSELERLLAEAEGLSSKKIEFEEMTGNLLDKSDGGANTLENGIETIYLDPNRINEYLITHEIYHVILHRKGGPIMYSTIQDDFYKELASNLDNSLDHYVFFPILDSIINVSDYRDKIINRVCSWPSKEEEDYTQEEDYTILLNSMFILDCFSFGDKYKSLIKEKLKYNYPKALDLATKLDNIRINNGKTKNGIRKSMNDSLNIIKKFIDKQNNVNCEVRYRRAALAENAPVLRN